MKENKFLSHNAYSGLHLFNETQVDLPVNKKTLHLISSAIEKEENCTFHLIEVVFVDEAEIIRINKEHLQRNYVTDIISFRYDDAPDNNAIEGTLYCCAPRIIEQAKEHNENLKREFKRIVIHGMLHLVGYDDQSPESKSEMRKKEDFFLSKV
jgi:rRNA maturation RNase YbeY